MSVADTTLLHAPRALSPAAATRLGTFSVPLILIALGILCLPIDIPVAQFCLQTQFPRTIVDLLKNAEAFGHSAGVGMIVLTVLFLDPQGRTRAINAMLCAITAGMSANVIKLCIGRLRPHQLLTAPDDLATTFTGLFRFAAGGSAHQSFPSAHTATAIGLAVALSAAYPRGRIWFFVMAALVGMQRVQTSAHFPSDVFAGAATGWIAAQLILAWRSPSTSTSAT
ncbi:MAG TPA: phosphatase PAP2 family protein [Planctomycetaceae bacterium]|jgi:membrane-associated phospholipid phosphatase|nr:phosphatase PAP2 family protein [Planctomycetaceae bacterium]